MDKKIAAKQFKRYLEMSVQGAELTDSKAIEVSALYPEWTVNNAYVVDEIVRYGVDQKGASQLYRILQAHTSQDDWLPDKTPAMYKAIGFTPEGIAIWVQPLAAVDAYKKGDIVSHKDKLWTSDVDANVWEPGVYGWTEKIS